MTIIFTILATFGMCGIPPIPPVGCSGGQQICVCDDKGDCNWQFICGK